MQQRLDALPRVQESDSVARHRVRQADVQVQPQRSGDLVGEEPAQGATGGIGASDQLGFIPAQADRVIAVPGAGRPPRLLRSQYRRQSGRVGDVGHRGGRCRCAQSGLVGQQLADGDGVLAGLGELGPQVGDHVVVAEVPRETARATANAATPLVVEKTLTMVSACQGCRVWPSR